MHIVKGKEVMNMELDEKTIMELAAQLGISADKKTAMAKAHSLEQKSDSELMAEIVKLREKLNQNNIPYEKQMAMVKSLMPMMSGQQKARLSRIIRLLEK